MNPMQMIVGLIPWWVFSSMASRTGEHAAANAALVSAIVAFAIAHKDRKHGGYKTLDVTGIVTFAGLAVIAYAGGDGAERWVADYGRAASTLLLALAMFASVVTVPFTEQYARQSAPPEVWHSPAFRAGEPQDQPGVGAGSHAHVVRSLDREQARSRIAGEWWLPPDGPVPQLGGAVGPGVRGGRLHQARRCERG